jgi:hypothetical protein
MPTTLTRKLKIAGLFFIVALGLSLRICGLGRVGFNEDEVHKVQAARSYARNARATSNLHITRLSDN